MSSKGRVKGRARRNPTSTFRVDGKVRIGSRIFFIQNELPENQRHVAAYSPAQALKLFALRFERIYNGDKVYLGDAEVTLVKNLPPPAPKEPKVEQLTLRL